MARVSVRLPGLLASLVGGTRVVAVEAPTVRDALDALFAVHPELRVHVFDESGAVRPHVSCFHRDHRIDTIEALDHDLADGDDIVILQAVSGG